jgi:anaerobic magnesium-protoporphyrin IX monomethyl ester cyclase
VEQAVMGLDAIIISDVGTDSVSGTSSNRLHIFGKIATIQEIKSNLKKQCFSDSMSWASSRKLNGLYLYSFLKMHGFDIELIDSFADERALFIDLVRRKPKAVIVSTTFIISKERLRRLVADIRRIYPAATVIVGGSFVYSSYLIREREINTPGYIPPLGKKDFLFLETDPDEPQVDLYIVSLRGEKILCDLLENIRQGKSVGLIPNSAKIEGGQYLFGERIDDVSDAAPITIDWESLPDAFYRTGVIPFQASNGCPFHCSFCNFTKDKRVLHVTTLDKLIRELKVVRRRGARYVWFLDDNFRLGRNDLNEVCNRLIVENLDLRWMSFIRASTLARTDAALLKQAGCVEVQLGLESGDQHILQNMNKNADVETYADVLQRLMYKGINCSSYFIFGFPGETEASVKRTCEFIKHIEYPDLDGVLTWSLFPFILSPLSPIYEREQREKYGIKGHMQDWVHDTMNFTQARTHLIQTFFELENSGVLYRGDNQDLYLELSPSARKEFVRLRHAFSKQALMQKLNTEELFDKMQLLLN